MPTTLTEVYPLSLNHLSQETRLALPSAFCNFIDVVEAATDRATHYNTKKEQNDAVSAVHRELFKLDRGVYGLCLLLPGVNDFAMQMGLGFMLDNPRDGEAILTPEQEKN